MTTIYFTDSTPGTLIYAFPITASLAQWVSSRVQLIEGTSPNTGRWSGTLTPGEWRIFEGSTQPTDFSEAIYTVIIPEPSNGTGARTVVITVLLSGNPVEGASVRLTKAAETYVQTTNELGEVVFSVDDGTWEVAIYSPGTSFTPTDLVVAADVDQEYTVTAVSIPSPPSIDLCSVYATTVDKDLQPEPDIEVTAYLDGVTGSGVIYTREIITETSNAQGIVVFFLGKGLTYRFRRENGKLSDRITIPADQDEYQIPSLLR